MGTFRFVGAGALAARGAHALEQAVKESAENVVETAKSNAPVESGALEGGISVSEQSATSATISTGGDSEEYAGYVHEGTTRITPNPFLLQALLQEAPGFRAAVASAARKVF